MRVTRPTLHNLLLANVAEVKFERRKPKAGSASHRRMLCTNNLPLLNSAKGRTALSFDPPSQAPKYNPNTKNLIITWDIFMQGFRTISMESCELISIIPANDLFWDYFSSKLVQMSPEEKSAFMNV